MQKKENKRADNVGIEIVGIEIEGALTIETVADVKARLIKGIQAGRENIIDLNRIEEFDTYGVQLLLSARRAMEESGGRLILTTVPEKIATIFKRAGLQVNS